MHYRPGLDVVRLAALLPVRSALAVPLLLEAAAGTALFLLLPGRVCHCFAQGAYGKCRMRPSYVASAPRF